VLKLAAFESIGDNCEFGLVQKTNGFDEGALFKWARIPALDGLIKLLRNDFSNFYRFDNLSPIFDDMVEDKSCGILFHTDMFSHEIERERRWVEPNESLRREIYNIEYEKRIYLVDKFKASIAVDEKIFVFKINKGALPAEIRALHDALCYFGKCHLLYVEKAPDETGVGEICEISKGLWRAYIPRFAPYWPVSDYLPGAWERICEEAFAAIRGK
jgi:ethanolamine utilization protein EutP (predicted NTPase)